MISYLIHLIDEERLRLREYRGATLLSRFSRVQLCAASQTAAHEAPSPFPGILQARTLEWVAISLSVHDSEK